MVTAGQPEPGPGSRLRELMALPCVRPVNWIFTLFLAIQAAGFLILGTGRWGSGLAEAIVVSGNLVALFCTWVVFRRSKGVAAIFWFLFGVILLDWLGPNICVAYQTLFAQHIVSDSTWRLMYCLYGAPILMIIFLPDTYEGDHVKSEIFLDLFQIGIVVALVYSTFFFLPARRMLPAEAFLWNVNMANVQSVFLLIAVLIRLLIAHTAAARVLFLRFGLFLLVCAVLTFFGDWIDVHLSPSATAWFNLAWLLNQAAPALIAITWFPDSASESTSDQGMFVSFLATNLALVGMLVGMNVLMDRWKQAYGEYLTGVAIVASLIAFTLRLALTQYHQQREILRRKAAQEQVFASNDRIVRLLEDARRQTAEITQISDLGSLLQACSSREEVFQLISERLSRLFPGASGSVSVFNASRSRLETVAPWGPRPTGQIVTSKDCWALRRGSVHTHPRGRSASRCHHLSGEGASICLPLVAIGEAIGVLAIEDNDLQTGACDPDSEAKCSAHCLHLASAVAEHIAVAIANLRLRESLRSQAVRDPLTGLYNRRYMQEFLERELNSARRKHRHVAVMMLDIDHFKQFNDTFGHSAGDRVLANVGEILLRSVRAEDVACRYGGEEFTLILPDCSLQQAMLRAEAVRNRIAENSLQGQGSQGTVTISIGVAAYDETTDRVEMLLKFADDALYEAKRAGRNRAVQARSEAIGHDQPDPTAKSAAASE